jgi:hypothetical protein
MHPMHKGQTRRQVIRSMVGASVLLPGIVSELLAEEGRRPADPDPLGPRPPHFPARAKRVIFVLSGGGVSHLDTFDPKPRLTADHGKKMTFEQEAGMVTLQDHTHKTLMRSDFAFKRHGRCGTEVSELFPHLGGCADHLCVIRSMKTEIKNHVEATIGLHTGSFTVARPSMGSWVSYGLGTLNKNLPSFVVISPGLPMGGSLVWAADFLPGVHQGTLVSPGAEPIPDLRRRGPSPELQEMQLGLLEAFNRHHLETRGADPALAARIKTFETAFGMQREAGDAFDLSKESDATLNLYGLKRGATQGFGWQCLVARRLAERGVRFIELIESPAGWDAHGDMKTYKRLAPNLDRPLAGLLKDLKGRGMLDETLVVWTTEFGRPPFVDLAEPGFNGRGHQSSAYSSWMAGGGVKGGITHGKTDDYGIFITQDPVSVYDFNATILHLLGLDHTRLTYHHAGRDFRLTDVHGRVVKEILA